MNLFTSPMYNFAIMCPYKITYLLHSISILPSKYILRWKYIRRNKNQLNLFTVFQKLTTLVARRRWRYSEVLTKVYTLALISALVEHMRCTI